MNKQIKRHIKLHRISTINMIGWLFGFYGISTFVGYLMPNPFLCKFQTIQFSMSTQFNCQKHFYFKLFKFSISIDFLYTQVNVKTVLY